MPELPTDAQVWLAIDAFLRHAYAGKTSPAGVKAKLDVLRAACGSLLKASAFEKSDAPGPPRYALRLGNQFFPHMKLVVECRPENERCFFRADAHDAHCRPKETSSEMGLYRELVEKNRTISTAIETEWADLGLPTFKTFLREDLARRGAARP